jgi:tol-pal system protein YbgF
MKNAKTALLTLALVALLAGCMPTQRELAMERDLEEMKRRLAATERSLAVQQLERTDTTRQQLDELTRQQAKVTADLDNLRLELQSVSGRFADQTRQREELREELALVRDDMGLRIDALEKRQAPPAADTAEGGKTPTATPLAGANTAPTAQRPETVYLEAVDLIRNQQQYAAGRRQLEDFLKRYPRHSLAANAAYWIGESFAGEKEYEKAILQFEDVVSHYGDHPKVAAAYLKQALTFDQLGDRQSAQLILRKLAERFPLSEEAHRAKEQLKSWND